MNLLAIDPSATRCGVAWWQMGEPERLIHHRSFASHGNTAEEKCASFGEQLGAILDEIGPGYVCFEAAQRYIAGYKKKGVPDLAGATGGWWTPNSDQMILPELQGHARQACMDRKIPFESVAVKTWRAALYGKGGGSLSRDAAKAAAKNYCRLVGIDPRNDDEAEACCILLWCSRCSQMLKFQLMGLA